MDEELASARGERAAIGGYLPQFDEFAWFVYFNLINKKLEWIRIADPKAEKLDDIQYSTYSEIHAYQVKWTIADAKISYTNFTDLIPLIASSWKSLKKVNSGKRIIPHLITNKSVSSHDSLKDGDTKIGSFEDFIFSVWHKIKSNQKVDDKWKSIIQELKTISQLSDPEFHEFVKCFDFKPSYKKREFEVRKMPFSKEDEDLVKLTRFLWEEVGGNERNVEFSREKIIQRLGWADRFKTIFNHELVIDRKKYQPIQSTIDLLNLKLAEYKNGYLFLKGGPGSGKSTLLNQWSKGLSQRIIKYYAFDFVNPSSNLNFHDRGNATHLFFDLVFQLKEAGIYKREILPYKNLIFLKEVFDEQLKAIGQDFINTGQPTILIIDGLDHVPREYKITTNSFLRELPLPDSLPEGVYIILGSQSFELDDIQQEIQTEFQKGNRTIQIGSLKKEEVYAYIDSLDSFLDLNSSHKLQIFEKSQGHPLYLSYLIEKINQAESINDVIESFDKIEGDIENYYKKIWKPIQKEEDLVNLLGLITRINGATNLSFVKEWRFDRKVLKSFKEKASVLFNETEKMLSFFHNSFKQFLLHYTALDYLTDEFDSKVSLGYHNQLADFYKKSEVEQKWKQNYHLFQAKRYDRFVLEVTPDNFTAQLLNYRPAEEIKQDIKLGVEIAKQTKDINILIKYLFSLAEIERRLYNIDPASLTEELLILGKFDIARDYLRTGNVLHCVESYALKASRLFIAYDFKSEGEILFNLAYPEIITDSGISIENGNRFDEIEDILTEWVYVAPYFENLENIFHLIDNINYSDNLNIYKLEEKQERLPIALITHLGYSLIEQNKWDDFDQVVQKMKTTSKKSENSVFRLIRHAIEKCLDLKESNHANKYLSLLTTYFTKEKTKPIGKIYIADLIFKVTGDVDKTYSWIKDVKQPSKIKSKDRIGYDDSLGPFIPLIKLNKLLNLCNKGISITSAIPSVNKGADEDVLMEFERMLCLIAQILADGILQKPVFDITSRVYPVVRFYYRELSHRNSYWYELKQSKGSFFSFLIFAVTETGSDNLEILGDYFFNEFTGNQKYWSASIQRKIVKSLLNNGFDSEKAIVQLKRIEGFMFEDHDIHGRITECLVHSKVWLLIDKQDEGEKWLKQGIQESIGVGYRKDYQFSTWIKWLRKINLKEPSGAPERITWFLSHLNHIKETTEGRAYWNASEELLEVTFEHNFHDGFEQLTWQLDHNLIDFKSSLSLFVKYFIKRIKTEEEFRSIVQLYNDLYLLVSESADSLLLKNILAKGNELLKKRFLEKYIPDIISAITIKGYEENRYHLLSEIDDFFSSKGIKIEDYYPDFKIPLNTERGSSQTSSNNLTLKSNHEEIDEEEVLKRVTNFDDFKRIVQREDQANSFFNWSKVIKKIASLLSSNQIQEIANLGNFGRNRSDFYAKLSGAALKLGEQELATSLANKSIELSSKSGWVKFYDGGSRINAFNALKKIDPVLSYKKAFEVFSQDMVSDNYASSYIQQLEDIVPLLTENYKEEELWSEIFRYLVRLMSNSDSVKDLPVLSSINQPIMETLVGYLLRLSKSPVPLIKEQSIILLTKYINQNDDYTLTQLLNESIDDYSFMDIIMALSELKFPKIHVLKSKIQNLSISKDYRLRENSKDILTELRLDIPIPKNIKLPSVYSLHIPKSKKLDFDKEIDPYFPKVDVNDYRDLIRPFEPLISVLSEESGIDESNLVYRVHSIMKKIGNEEEWTFEYEKKLRSHLEEINVKYSYTRLRVIAARRAVMHVTSELIDSGAIKSDRIRNVFRFRDYAVQHFDEVPKPVFIQTIKERDFGGVDKDWLERINESPRLTEPLLNYGENFKVIGEYSKIKNLDWGSPTEEYMSRIAVTEEQEENDYYIFGSVFHQLSHKYHGFGGGGHSIIVIRDHRYDQFNLKSRWIAINPVLARYLEWQPEPNKMFAWKNLQGELMAESIYWSNGNISMTPRKDGEVGEGWFVLVSEDGLEQIKTVEKNLFLQKKLSRSKYENSDLKENQMSNVTKI